MRLVAIVQARLSSSRLPGKVLMKLGGKTVLNHIFERLERCIGIDQLVIATSRDKSDDPIEKWARSHKIDFYRGSLDDVLERYYEAALMYKAQAILRITGDCPLIDPETISELIDKFRSSDKDGYCLAGEFPDGLDSQIFSFNAIEKAHKNAKLLSEREHVGPYIENNKELFKIGLYKKFNNLSHHRWTLDEPKDYEFLKEVFDNLYLKNNQFSVLDLLNFLDSNPDIFKINSNIIRNQGYIKSLRSDKLIK